jgi:hypothetical protein
MDRTRLYFLLIIFTSVKHLSGQGKIDGNKLIKSGTSSPARIEDHDLIFGEFRVYGLFQSKLNSKTKKTSPLLHQHEGLEGSERGRSFIHSNGTSFKIQISRIYLQELWTNIVIALNVYTYASISIATRPQGLSLFEPWIYFIHIYIYICVLFLEGWNRGTRGTKDIN